MEASGLVHMLDNDRIADLARVYRLFEQTPPADLKHLREAMASHIVHLGKARCFRLCSDLA